MGAGPQHAQSPVLVATFSEEKTAGFGAVPVPAHSVVKFNVNVKITLMNIAASSIRACACNTGNGTGARSAVWNRDIIIKSTVWDHDIIIPCRK